MIPVNRKNSFVLYLEDLPQDCMETDIIKLMQPYGRVNAVTIHRHHSGGHQTRTSGVSATAEFQLREHAESVLHYLENNVVWGKKLKVQLLNPPGLNTSAPVNNANPKPMRSAQVHISYLSKQLNTMVSEQMIYELFTNFGKVLEVSLKKKCVDTEMCIQNGYGFVHYPLTSEGIDSALKAVESLHQVTINNVSYDCSVSNQLRQVLFNTGRLLKKGSNSASSQPNLQGNNSNLATRVNTVLPSNSNIRTSMVIDPGMLQAASSQQNLQQQQMNSIQNNVLNHMIGNNAIFSQQQQQLPLRQTASWSEGAGHNNIQNMMQQQQQPQLQQSAYHVSLNNTGANTYQSFTKSSYPTTFVTSSNASTLSPIQQLQNSSVTLRHPHTNLNTFSHNAGNGDFVKDRDVPSNRPRSFYNNINTPMQHGQDPSSMAYLDDMATTVGTLSLGASMDASSSWSDMKSVAGSSHSSLASLLVPGTANGSFYLENNNNHQSPFVTSNYASHNASFSDGSIATNNIGNSVNYFAQNNNSNNHSISGSNITVARNNAAAVAALTGAMPPVPPVVSSSPHINNTSHYLSRSTVNAASFPTSLPPQSSPQQQRSPALSALHHNPLDADTLHNKSMLNFPSNSQPSYPITNNMNGLAFLQSDSGNSGASLDDLISLPTLETSSKDGVLSSISSPNYDQQHLQFLQSILQQQHPHFGNTSLDTEIAWN